MCGTSGSTLPRPPTLLRGSRTRKKKRNNVGTAAIGCPAGRNRAKLVECADAPYETLANCARLDRRGRLSYADSLRLHQPARGNADVVAGRILHHIHHLVGLADDVVRRPGI